MGIKEKLRKYCKHKGLSYAFFCSEIGVSDKFLATNGRVYSDVLPKIRKVFTDLNMDWLQYNEGEMIVSKVTDAVFEPQAGYQKDTELMKKINTIDRKLDFLLVFNKIDIESVDSVLKDTNETKSVK